MGWQSKITHELRNGDWRKIIFLKNGKKHGKETKTTYSKLKIDSLRFCLPLIYLKKYEVF